MRAVVQRIKNGKVSVDGAVTGEIEQGLLVYLAVAPTDTEAVAEKMALKIINLRIFEDAEGKMNLNLQAVNGQLLIVSQFTLYADTKKGNRPSYNQSAEPTLAKQLYDYFVDYVRKTEIVTATGIFGASMDVSYTNVGPVTIILDIDAP
ncbi:MAG TPA: D-aminoacyl-tRNA deacylase [Spirochaetia bacterium]|nr:D-aminoacyl-tRNA deacylase [Spirochaetales bacterium]HPD81247.1 D-aminoacyl-tRNA deacylase [Spirochaetales bacterium]HRS66499.1 D-aminoacyl-tRNA deacylase [Spirochaetia bacterium]